MLFLLRCLGSILIAYAIAACYQYQEYTGIGIFVGIFVFAIIEYPPQQDDNNWY